jgi:hypothetical protein
MNEGILYTSAIHCRAHMATVEGQILALAVRKTILELFKWFPLGPEAD